MNTETAAYQLKGDVETRQYELKGLQLVVVPKRNRKRMIELNKHAIPVTEEGRNAEIKRIKEQNKVAATNAKKAKIAAIKRAKK